MEYNDKKTLQECSFFEVVRLFLKIKYFRFQLKIIILCMIFIIIPSIIAIESYIENDVYVISIFAVIVLAINLIVELKYRFQVYLDCLRNTEKSKKLYNAFKKYEYNEFIQLYEMQKGTFNLSPSEYLKVYNEKLLDRSFLLYKNNSKYIVSGFFYYQAIASLNEIVLNNKTDYNFILSSKIERLNKLYKYKSKKIQGLTGTLILENIILAYTEKNYEKVFEYIKEYFTAKAFTKFDLRKTILVFLYISAKKTGQDTDFLPKTGKERLEEALQEEEYARFIERELGEDFNK